MTAFVDLWTYGGGLVLVTAYMLLATGRCCGHGWLYNGSKLFGYSSVAANGLVHEAIPMVVLGCCYCVFAVVALVRHWRTVIITT